jgi:hypothetical protein
LFASSTFGSHKGVALATAPLYLEEKLFFPLAVFRLLLSGSDLREGGSRELRGKKASVC